MLKIAIAKMDFAPKGGGSYNINWPGPPRRQLHYSDVKHYLPTIELKAKPPIGFTLYIYIKEYREALGVDELMADIELGWFDARFDAGKTSPTEIKMVNAFAGPPKDPEGAPENTYGSFWLGVSKGGRIRGNSGTGDDGHARVYLELFSGTRPTSYQLTGKMKSPRHTVKAI
jgi:hypothetical protein